MSTPDATTARLIRALDEAQQLVIAQVTRRFSDLKAALLSLNDCQRPLDDQLAALALRELLPDAPTPRVTADGIVTATWMFYDLTVEELLGRGMTRNVAWARQVSMYLCRELTDLSMPAIGEVFDRDHTTVMHAHQKITRAVADDPGTAQQIRDLTALVQRRAAVTVLHAVADPTRCVTRAGWNGPRVVAR